MESNLEQRVTVLEQELGLVKQMVHGGRPEKDWRKTFGMSADDPGFKEMVRLGQQAREEAREDDIVASCDAWSSLPSGTCCHGARLRRTSWSSFGISEFGSGRWT